MYITSGYAVTGYELRVTVFEARSRIFLPLTQSCAAVFCCRLAILASSLGWLVGNYSILLGFGFKQENKNAKILFKQRTEQLTEMLNLGGKTKFIRSNITIQQSIASYQYKS